MLPTVPKCTKMFLTAIMNAEQSATAHGMLAGCTTPPRCVLGRTTPPCHVLGYTTLPCQVLGRFKQVVHLRTLHYEFSVQNITEQFCAGTYYSTMSCARTYYSGPCYDEMSTSSPFHAEMSATSSFCAEMSHSSYTMQRCPTVLVCRDVP